MIRQFTADTALLLIDVQQGVDDLRHWGGATARRNNPAAEANALIHATAVANRHGEFCTAIDHAAALGLLAADAGRLARAQGNE